MVSKRTLSCANEKCVYYVNRQTGFVEEENIYCKSGLRFLYGSSFGRFFANLIARNPFFSKIYGWLQSLFVTKYKITPFVKRFALDASEFEKPLSDYVSFNDFFIRKLKPEARPFGKGVILPADGRYLFYQNVALCNGFVVKGKKFELSQLIGDRDLASGYCQGSMLLARLCPADYHRFHFPCSCIPSEPSLIKGPLYSVNPIAIRQHLEWLAENKRMLTKLKTKQYGQILFIEVGATNVGSIHQTYTPNKMYQKGEEKGYFSFGGSSIILLFESDRIRINQKLLTNSSQHVETLCLFGQSIENKI